MVGVAGGQHFANGRAGGGGGFGVGQAMGLGVERVTDGGNEGNEADAAGDVAAGVLEEAQLLDQTGLAGAFGGFEEGESVVEEADEDLERLVFLAVEFLDFEAEVGALGVVGFLEEFGEGGGFGGHLFGDVAGGGDGVGGMFLDDLPAGGGGVDLGGDEFKVADFGDGGGESGGFGHAGGGAVFEDVGEDGEDGASEAAAGEEAAFPEVHGSPAMLPEDEIREGEEHGVADKERRFGEVVIVGRAHKVRQFNGKR